MTFRFSPRPNRAHELPWRDFTSEVFAEAKELGKPILLSISAVWCHWCHVMDERTYSDPEVQALIRQDFIPVRVDTDERPDVNARYNMGGWPTTAFLTPMGEVLTGATYVPPEDMVRLLQEVRRYYDAHRGELEVLPLKRPELPPPKRVPKEVVEAELRAAADSEHGGFGQAPKFPQAEALSYLLQRERQEDLGFRPHLRRTLAAMVRQGLWDPVEGGFFRYATQRDWSSPHTEKLLVDNARLIGVYALAAAVWPEEQDVFRGVAEAIVRYLDATLRRGELYSGSQDADETYYRCSGEERLRHPAPFVDPEAYCDGNALLAENLILAGALLNQPAWVEAGCRLFRAVVAAFWQDDRLRHTADGKGGLYDYLADYVAFGRAAALADLVGMEEARPLFREVADRLMIRRDETGLIRDLPEPGPGRLQQQPVVLAEEAEAASLLLMAAAAFDQPSYRDAAGHILERLGGLVAAYGTLAAPYALAVWQYERPPLEAAFAPDCPRALRLAVLQLADPLKIRIEQSDVPSGSAVLCQGSICSAPVRSAEALLAVRSHVHPDRRQEQVGQARRVVVGRVPEGADLLAYLTEVARRHGISFGFVSVIGAVRTAVVWYFDQTRKTYQEIRRAEPLEIATATGNISLRDGEPFCHVHAVFSDRAGRAWAGHLAAGTQVYTAEYWIEEVEGSPLVRQLDPDLGLWVWGGPASPAAGAAEAPQPRT